MIEIEFSIDIQSGMKKKLFGKLLLFHIGPLKISMVHGFVIK